MDGKMRDALIRWPSQKVLQKAMSFCFRAHCGLRLVAIIDCFELFIEKPSNLLQNLALGHSTNTITQLSTS